MEFTLESEHSDQSQLDKFNSEIGPTRNVTRDLPIQCRHSKPLGLCRQIVCNVYFCDIMYNVVYILGVQIKRPYAKPKYTRRQTKNMHYVMQK